MSAQCYRLVIADAMMQGDDKFKVVDTNVVTGDNSIFMEKLKCQLFKLWKRLLMTYRTMLIKAESNRRKMNLDTRHECRKRRKNLSDQHDGHKNAQIIIADAHDTPATTPTNMLEYDRLEMKRAFDLFDEDKDGLISTEELQHYMNRLGFDLSEQKIRRMVRTVDRNGDEYIDFEEFFSLYSPLSSGAGDSSGHDSIIAREDDEEEETLLKAFFVFDDNRDGFICRLELQQALVKLGLPEGRSLMCCQKMIEQVDADGNGKVDFFEFKSMMRSNSVAFYRS